MTAIMPFQENETNHSGGRTATTGLTATRWRLVLTGATIVVGARAIFLLLLANASARTATTRLTVRHDVITPRTSTKRLIARHTIAWSKLNFQLDDLVPLLICPIALRY